MTSSVFKIVPTTQQYDWGKIGSKSAVAQLVSSSKFDSNFVLDESKPYAELWMGTHPTSPSHLPSPSRSTLSSHLKSYPSLIGDRVAEKFPDAKEGNLPFLFKVLSIEKALSIQTHPDKKTAQTLHAQLPHIYKDDNHKPELALALTPFRALCGFKPLSNIAKYLFITPELSALIPKAITENFLSVSSGSDSTSPEAKAALKDLFSALMNADETLIKGQLEALVHRYQSPSSEDGSIEELVLRLNSQFPGDVGVFCAFILNYITLSPGEAIFLGAGEPHAYVSGDIIECMANSDNVIRAGLTPKLRDIPNLVAGLTYVPAEATRHRVQPSPFPPSSTTSVSTLYDPPIPEFSVVQVRLDSQAQESHPPVKGPSLTVVTKGKGMVSWNGDTLQIERGDVFFIGADTGVQLEGEDLVLYRAFVEA
ncbi:mannose-6-phosphate isomerase [Lentinula detonsa]|uniref:Mannose-6-phosphate isomerase n=1 Tax=Lentinula detonsa TaxID=2804962 RepID=A0A9W8P4D1_9AGAR|nr:mannose-6-phosphate isomerase [Lentinula detonsa]KAJ3982480.1 mannose-6-phosphate isomerase [Lentinula detonsa]